MSAIEAPEWPLAPIRAVPPALAAVIREAPDGATICVIAGDYSDSEPIRIDRPLTITGEYSHNPPRWRLPRCSKSTATTLP